MSVFQYLLVALTLSTYVSAGFWPSPPSHVDYFAKGASQRMHKRKLNLAKGTWTRGQGCTKYYNVRSRDTCTIVAQKNNLPDWTVLRQWNTGLDSECANLLLGYTYCVAGPTSAPASTIQVPGPTTRSDIVETVPSTVLTLPTPTTAAPTKAPTTAPAPAPTSASPSSKLVPGQATYYYAGLGACGKWNKDSDLIVAASYQMWNSWPGATANPNLHPICGQKIRAYSKQDDGSTKSVTVTIVDMCPSCNYGHLDMSPSAFQALQPLSKGLIPIQWEFVN